MGRSSIFFVGTIILSPQNEHPKYPKFKNKICDFKKLEICVVLIIHLFALEESKLLVKILADLNVS